MQKKTYTSVDLSCSYQHVEDLENDQCLNGVFSKTEKGFKFEEAIKQPRTKRNPKLFDGKYCSLVHMQNGKYQMHLKTMDETFDREKFAFGVYSEITNALKIMK